MTTKLAAVPVAKVERDDWSSERLARFLDDIDNRIAAGKFDSAVTLAYTVLEGFLKAFVAVHKLDAPDTADIIQLTKAVRLIFGRRSSIIQTL